MTATDKQFRPVARFGLYCSHKIW